MPLPDFIKPMLAQSGDAFDSDAHLFEIKWDGLRTMVYVDSDGYRLSSRRGTDVTERYPEFAFLNSLQPGTVLDGEVVVLDAEGKPDFRAVLQREQSRSAFRHRTLSNKLPATLILFDQLYANHQSLLKAPFSERRQQLSETVAAYAGRSLDLSEGVIGPGKDFFSQVVQRDLEGMVAKRLDSRYFPGKRLDAWIKVRKSSTILCAIIGYIEKGSDFESLIIATEEEGLLKCVGRVGSGFNQELRDQLNALLRQNTAEQPLVRCDLKGRWVPPGLYCSVKYLERTADGHLREPVFEKLIATESE